MGLADRLKHIFGRPRITESEFEQLEDNLIEADLGPRLAAEIADQWRRDIKKGRLLDYSLAKQKLTEVLRQNLIAAPLTFNPRALNIFLLLGVNGVGKTTTLAKLAAFYQKEAQARPVIGAGDTFRAAAGEQLKTHGQRLGLRVVAGQPGSDPGSVIFDALESAKAKNNNLVLADTAGRMHNQEGLIRELQKIDRIVKTRAGQSANYQKILVIDAVTGQNAVRQAEIFHQAVTIDSLIIAKYDFSGRGGLALAICRSLGIPISFLGVGESYADLLVFDPNAYINQLLER